MSAKKTTKPVNTGAGGCVNPDGRRTGISGKSKYGVEKMEGAMDENVKWKIERNGQEHQSKGNRICVRATIKIKTIALCYEILEDYQFGGRVRLFDEPLVERWGNYDDTDHTRYKTKLYYSNKWKTAFEEAKKEILSELKKLSDAIEERKRALEEAEYE